MSSDITPSSNKHAEFKKRTLASVILDAKVVANAPPGPPDRAETSSVDDTFGGNKLILVDPSTGETKEYALDASEQNIVAKHYLSKPCSERSEEEVLTLMQLFRSKAGFKDLDWFHLEAALRGAELCKHRRGTVLSTPSTHGLYMLQGTLGCFALEGLGNDFSGEVATTYDSTIHTWLSRACTSKPADAMRRKITGEVLKETPPVALQHGASGGPHNSESLGPVPGALHFTETNGDWHCWVTLNYVVAVSYLLPQEFSVIKNIRDSLEIKPIKGSANHETAANHDPVTSLSQRFEEMSWNFGDTLARMLLKIEASEGAAKASTIAQAFQPVRLRRGAPVLQVGEVPSRIFVLLEGEAKAVPRLEDNVLGPQEHGEELGRIGVDEWMGTLACCTHQREWVRYFVVSSTPVRAIAVPAEIFREEIAPNLLKMGVFTDAKETRWQALQFGADQGSKLTPGVRDRKRWEIANSHVVSSERYMIPGSHKIRCCPDLSTLKQPTPPPDSSAPVSARRREHYRRARQVSKVTPPGCLSAITRRTSRAAESSARKRLTERAMAQLASKGRSGDDDEMGEDTLKNAAQGKESNSLVPTDPLLGWLTEDAVSCETWCKSPILRKMGLFEPELSDTFDETSCSDAMPDRSDDDDLVPSLFDTKMELGSPSAICRSESLEKRSEGASLLRHLSTDSASPRSPGRLDIHAEPETSDFEHGMPPSGSFRERRRCTSSPRLSPRQDSYREDDISLSPRPSSYSEFGEGRDSWRTGHALDVDWSESPVKLSNAASDVIDSTMVLAQEQHFRSPRRASDSSALLHRRRLSASQSLAASISSHLSVRRVLLEDLPGQQEALYSPVSSDSRGSHQSRTYSHASSPRLLAAGFEGEPPRRCSLPVETDCPSFCLPTPLLKRQMSEDSHVNCLASSVPASSQKLIVKSLTFGGLASEISGLYSGTVSPRRQSAFAAPPVLQASKASEVIPTSARRRSDSSIGHVTAPAPQFRPKSGRQLSWQTPQTPQTPETPESFTSAMLAFSSFLAARDPMSGSSNRIRCHSISSTGDSSRQVVSQSRVQSESASPITSNHPDGRVSQVSKQPSANASTDKLPSSRRTFRASEVPGRRRNTCCEGRMSDTGFESASQVEARKLAAVRKHRQTLSLDPTLGGLIPPATSYRRQGKGRPNFSKHSRRALRGDAKDGAKRKLATREKTVEFGAENESGGRTMSLSTEARGTESEIPNSFGDGSDNSRRATAVSPLIIAQSFQDDNIDVSDVILSARGVDLPTVLDVLRATRASALRFEYPPEISAKPRMSNASALPETVALAQSVGGAWDPNRPGFEGAAQRLKCVSPSPVRNDAGDLVTTPPEHPQASSMCAYPQSSFKAHRPSSAPADNCLTHKLSRRVAPAIVPIATVESIDDMKWVPSPDGVPKPQTQLETFERCISRVSEGAGMRHAPPSSPISLLQECHRFGQKASVVRVLSSPDDAGNFKDAFANSPRITPAEPGPRKLIGKTSSGATVWRGSGSGQSCIDMLKTTISLHQSGTHKLST